MDDFQLVIVWRCLAWGLLAAGALKLLALFGMAHGLTSVQLHYQITTTVLYLGAGGTILIRQSE